MAQPFIPFHRPSIGREEAKAVNRVLASGWLTTGPVAHAFEREFAAYIGCKHALAVNSATSGLQLALDAIGLKAGDEVLVPSYTFTATAEVCTYFGARPVLCDSIKNGFNIDIADAERRITGKTCAIIAVHIAGEPCDMDAIGAIARRHHLHVIEDAAHALPASYRGRRIGTISDLTAFSFYATKTITTGEGGMLVTDSDEYAARISTMRLHGISGDAWKRYSKEGSWYYEVMQAGYKHNLPDLLAAVGRTQLTKCDRFFRERRAIAQCYIDNFSRIEELELPPPGRQDDEHAWHLFIVRIRPDMLELDRNAFIGELKHRGIGSSVHFIPLHLHPFYRQKYGYGPGDLPNAEEAYARCISLPIWPGMKRDEVERVVNAVGDVVARNRKPMAAVA